MSVDWPDDRKLAELRAKLSSLEVEFAHWRAQSADGMRLRKHNTQIRKVTAALDALRLRIEKQLDELEAGSAGAAKGVVEIETMILDIHRIWEFFRSKLSQRYVAWFQPFLVAADQFVWDCYTPVRTAIDPAHVPPDDVREPPMVFFNGGWSPFAMSRGIEYEAEFVPEEEFPRQRYRDILEHLPFPVIGIPWYQVRHLPDAVLLGHEVGHTVEDDFRLTERLEALLKAGLTKGKVKASRHAAWSAWLGETFADVYGVLAAGPAFVGALMDLVAGPRDRIATQEATAPDWGDYPPAALRVHVALTALAEVGFKDESTALRTRWVSLYPRNAMEPFEPDAEHVVRALLRTPIPELGDRPLAEVISFTASAAVAAEASALIQRKVAPTTKDARALLAAARLAFEEGRPGYDDDDVRQRVLDAIAAGQGRTVRGRTPGGAAGPGGGIGAGAGAAAGTAPARLELTEPEVALGDTLFDRLTALRA